MSLIRPLGQWPLCPPPDMIICYSNIKLSPLPYAFDYTLLLPLLAVCRRRSNYATSDVFAGIHHIYDMADTRSPFVVWQLATGKFGASPGQGTRCHGSWPQLEAMGTKTATNCRWRRRISPRIACTFLADPVLFVDLVVAATLISPSHAV